MGRPLCWEGIPTMDENEAGMEGVAGREREAASESCTKSSSERCAKSRERIRALR